MVLNKENVMAVPDGKCTVSSQLAYFSTPDDILRAFKLISKNSVYAYGEELKSGYLTRNNSVSAIAKSSSLSKDKILQATDVIGMISGAKAEDITVSAKP